MKLIQILESNNKHNSYKQKIAKKAGLSIKELDNLSDDEIRVILHNVGNFDFAPDSDFDKKELSLGIQVELEHTSSKLVAKLIAKDHLKEKPNYYTLLKKVEENLNEIVLLNTDVKSDNIDNTNFKKIKKIDKLNGNYIWLCSHPNKQLKKLSIYDNDNELSYIIGIFFKTKGKTFFKIILSYTPEEYRGTDLNMNLTKYLSNRFNIRFLSDSALSPSGLKKMTKLKNLLNIKIYDWNNDKIIDWDDNTEKEYFIKKSDYGWLSDFEKLKYDKSYLMVEQEIVDKFNSFPEIPSCLLIHPLDY